MNELQLPVELLGDYSDRKHEVTAEELERRCEKIRAALTLCELNPKKIIAAVGPVITTFRVIPDRKMKISELKNLASDIEYVLNIKRKRRLPPPQEGQQESPQKIKSSFCSSDYLTATASISTLTPIGRAAT